MANISRSTVSLRLFGPALDPADLTQRLGCTPSAAAKKGDQITKPNGTTRIVKRGSWRLSDGESDDILLEEKIEFLLQKLTDDLGVWHEITKDLEVADLFCGLFIDHWNEGFTLSPSIIRKIADRGLKINFDIYSPTDSWGKEDPNDSGDE